MGPGDRPTIGILTALPIEAFAVLAVLDEVAEVDSPESDDGGSYWIGSVPSSKPDAPHRVVVSLLTEDGGVAAAHGCANLQRTWRVDQVVMCGIACGVPRPDQPNRHVRLGDILVAEDGIVPYGHVRATRNGHEELRRPAARPSVPLKNAARRLQVDAESGIRAWEHIMDTRGRHAAEDYSRPSGSSDVLLDDEGNPVLHPAPSETGHVLGRPKIHHGWIGSGGKLINSAAERNRLALAFRLIGFDMEGDGVADTAYLQRVDWFMVRGVSDYGGGTNDVWHRYASLAAASYVRVLLGRLDPPAATAKRAEVIDVEAGGDRAHRALVDAVWAVRTMRTPSGRDRVVSELAETYGLRITRVRDAYLDVDGIVSAAGQIRGGLHSLIELLQSIEYDSAPLQQLVRLVGFPTAG
ncbi:hypothetical protein ACIA5D_31400 [Actinoplanes sp. NPDC051513]|uniref:effector-associated domain 2-containing protein n=1 Tax=Actinoplanes sp. NPDC051513 TaxID=3363908 RepID=UPI0037AD6A89